MRTYMEVEISVIEWNEDDIVRTSTGDNDISDGEFQDWKDSGLSPFFN